MNIVFWGTPEIALPSLYFFIKNENINVVAVVTQPDKPAGRGHKIIASPVKILAEANNIKVFQPKLLRKDSELIEILKSLKPDTFVTVAFGQILSQEILDIPRLGTINMHASLLPKYRGPNPIQWVLLNGEKITGITTMISDAGIDTGPILLTKEIEIDENINALQLSEIIANSGSQLLFDSINGLNDETLQPIPQDDENASYAPKLKKEDGKINWSEPNSVIHNKVRGMKPWPSTYTTFKDQQIKIIETALNSQIQNNTTVFGEIIGLAKNGIEVSTGSGIIVITKVQPAGKKEIDAKSWFNGARIQKFDKFE